MVLLPRLLMGLNRKRVLLQDDSSCGAHSCTSVCRLKKINFHLEIQPPRLDKLKKTLTDFLSKSRSQDPSVEFVGEVRRTGPPAEVSGEEAEADLRTPSPPQLPQENVDLEMGSAARERETGGEGVPRRSGRVRRPVEVDVGQELARAVNEGIVIADAGLVHSTGLQEALRAEFKAPSVLKASCKACLYQVQSVGDGHLHSLV
jgi:hypothetical protein